MLIDLVGSDDDDDSGHVVNNEEDGDNHDDDVESEKEGILDVIIFLEDDRDDVDDGFSEADVADTATDVDNGRITKDCVNSPDVDQAATVLDNEGRTDDASKLGNDELDVDEIKPLSRLSVKNSKKG